MATAPVVRIERAAGGESGSGFTGSGRIDKSIVGDATP